MSGPPRGLAGTSTSGAATTLTTVDPTWAAPVVNTTSVDPALTVNTQTTEAVLLGDGSVVRVRTLAGFFAFIGDCLYFPKGQRLCPADVARAGVGQPIWPLSALLGAVGVLRAAFVPGLHATVTAVAAIVPRFVQGYFYAGSVPLFGAVFGRFVPGLSAMLQAAGDVVGRYNPGTPIGTGLLTLAGAIAERFVPGLRATLTLAGAIAEVYQRGHTLVATLILSGALRRQVGAGRAATLRGLGALRRALVRAGDAATLAVTAALHASYGFVRSSFAATLALTVTLLTQRGHVFFATLTLSAALQRAIDYLLTGALGAAAALVRATVAQRTATLGATAALARDLSGLARTALSAALDLAASLDERLTKAFTATITALGALGPQQISKLLSGVLTLVTSSTHAIVVARAAFLTLHAVLSAALADPEIDSATLQILFDSATGEELFETSG